MWVLLHGKLLAFTVPSCVAYIVCCVNQAYCMCTHNTIHVHQTCHIYTHYTHTHAHTHVRTIHRFVADESGKIIDSGVMRMAKNDYEYLELKGLLYGLNAALELGMYTVYYYICYCYISYSYDTIVLQHTRNYAHIPYIICILYNRYNTRAYYSIILYITANILIHTLYTHI